MQAFGRFYVNLVFFQHDVVHFFLLAVDFRRLATGQHHGLRLYDILQRF